MNNTGRVISTAIQFIDGFTKPSKAVIASMKKMGNEAIRAGKQIQKAGKNIQKAGSALTTSITLPVAGVATAAVKTAADFESAMSEVGAISGASGKDMAKLTAKAKEMGATTAFSASESAEAMKYMAMAGWKTVDMTEGIAGIMNLAAASGEDLAATSDIVTDGLTAFGMTAKESSRFADVMAATSSNANTNVALMGETFKYCASTAGAMGYSVEDISVAIGIMGNAGIKGSMAGTTLKNTIANLAKPTDAQAAVMKKLGISLTDSSGNMKSFAEVMDNLRSSFSGLSETEKAAAATTLAGKQSMAGLLTIVNAGTEDFVSLTKAIKGSEGAAGTMAGKMLDNLNGQLTLLKSAIEGTAITIGNKLMPYVKTAVSWVQKAADYINNLSDAQFDNIIKWAGMAAAAGPAVLIFGKIVTAVGTAVKMFGTIKKTIANFGGIIGLLKSPAAVVIAVLVAVAVAAFLIIKNWDKIKPVVMRMKQWFTDTFGGPVKQVITVFTEIFTKAMDTVKRMAPSVGQFLQNAFHAVVPVIRTVAGVIIQIAPIIAGTFADVLRKLSPLVRAIGNVIKAVAPVIGKLLCHAFQFVGDTIKKIMPAITKIAQAVGSVLVFAVKKAAPVISKLAGIFSTVFASIFNTVSKAVKKMQPVFNAIAAVIKGVMNVVKNVIGATFRTAAAVISSSAGSIKQVISGIVFESLVGLVKTPINAVIGLINGAIAAINKVSVTIPDWVPGMGGKTFGVNIPSIPFLYKGTKNWKGGAAVIHDRGGEIVDLPQGTRVYPHDKSIEMARRDGEKRRKGNICIKINKLADRIEVRSDSDIDRIAEELAYKLEQIAFNTGKA